MVNKFTSYCRKKSPWVTQMSCGGCNGCNIEITACLTPRYDFERFGTMYKGNPRHTDILLVSGIIGRHVKKRLIQVYEQMPEPTAVIAVGACPITKGAFYDSYNSIDTLDKVIPVDIYVPGCPPKPEAILDAILKAREKFSRK